MSGIARTSESASLELDGTPVKMTLQIVNVGPGVTLPIMPLGDLPAARITLTRTGDTVAIVVALAEETPDAVIQRLSH